MAEKAPLPPRPGAELLSVAAGELNHHVLHRENPLAKIGYKSEDVFVPKGDKQRRLHKALLRYHDPANWPLIRQALEAMGKKHLIGSRRDCLVPAPTIEEMREARRQNRNTRPALTKHTPMATQRQTPATAKSVVYAISSGECWYEETP